LAKTINLNFDGYWREINTDSIPRKSGVYAVYVGRYDEQNKTVTFDKLIYFGEAEDANERISNHDKWGEWRKEVPKGSETLFSFAEVVSPDRERAQCALIYYHQPVCNEKSTEEFPYEETTVVSTGKAALIKSPITMKKTPS
jgi:hypothetical protein